MVFFCCNVGKSGDEVKMIRTCAVFGTKYSKENMGFPDSIAALSF